MRSAPSVTFPVGRSRYGRGIMLLAWLLGLATLALWLLHGPAPGWRHALAGGALLACAAVAWWSWRRQPQAGELAWDGAAWTWSAGAAAGPVHLEVACDLQSAMLVHLRSVGGGLVPHSWLWLEPQTDTEAWQAVRRAVYFRAGPQAQPGGSTAS